MLDDLIPSRFGSSEERCLALVIAALNIGDEFGCAGMAVGDAGVDVRSGVEQEVEGLDLPARCIPAKLLDRRRA